MDETRGSVTTTNNNSYDGDGQLIAESVSNATTVSDYLIHSTVLRGALLTKLDASGNKSITYVPANGLVMPMQQKDGNGNPQMSWIHRDALGLQEGRGAYDPLGNLAYNQTPDVSGNGPPPGTSSYGPNYSGVGWSTFSNANNFSGGCMMDGVAASCDRVMHYLNDGWANPDPNATRPWTSSLVGQPNPPPGAIGTLVKDPLPGNNHSGPPPTFRRGPGAPAGPGESEYSYHWEYSLITGDLFGGEPQKRSDTTGDKDLHPPTNVPISGKELTPCVKEVLSKYFDPHVLAAIRIHDEGLPWFVPPGNIAYTASVEDIYFAKGQYNPQTQIGIGVIAHEMVHIQQRRKYGDSLLSAVYLGDSLGVFLINGWKYDAEDNDVEKPAYAKEKEILADLEKRFGKGKNPCP